MAKYELMTITQTSLGEDGARKISNTIKDLITANKGKILDTDVWGKRTFAYEIKNETEGYYEIIYFELDTGNMSKLKQKLNLLNGLVRYLITATE